MLDRLEKKFGKYAIHNFSYYIMIVYVIGSLIGIIAPNVYSEFLAIDIDAIIHGQIWRLITFIFYPYIGTSVNLISILFGVITIYLYYFIGSTLEREWGAFRFNVYYISGFLLNIIATLFLYLIFKESYSFGMKYIQNALFLAFATIMPDVQFRLYFIIPVKVKWLGYLYGAFLLYEIISNLIPFSVAGLAVSIGIIISILNFLVYFIGKNKKTKPSKRTKDFKKKMNKASKDNKEKAEHTCCICGRTNLTNPELQFRYCSKCKGAHEYCSDHIFSHEHKE